MYRRLTRGKPGAITLASLLLCATAPAAAAVTWYQIETIVFARTSAPETGEEVWDIDPGQPDLTDVLELSVPLDDGAADGSEEALTLPFQLLPRKKLELGAAARRIRRAGQYRLLSHIAWRQPGFSRKRARAVHIRTLAVQPDAPRVLTGNTTSLTGLAVGPAAEPLAPELDGWFKLYRARYLHAEMDLLLRNPAASNAPAAAGESVNLQPLGFRLHQSRRMRSREIHYIDHPRFGVIVLATPVERQAPPVLPPPAAPSPAAGNTGITREPGAPKP